MRWFEIDAKPGLTQPQELLLRAALLDGDAALAAWRSWRAANRLDTIDGASFDLLPRLYLNLQRLGAKGDPWLPKLRGVHRHSWLRSEVTVRAAADAVARLSAAGVQTLLLGGIALAIVVDDDPGRRLVAVDIHVDQTQLAAAVAALEGAGWRIGDPALVMQLAPFMPAIVGRNPAWADTTLRLHLHPLALGTPGAAERELRRRASRREFQGSAVLVPDPTDLLMLACLGGRSPDPALACGWIADVLALIGGSGIEWDALLERSRRAGLARSVCGPLLEVHQRFESAVPAAVIERARAEIAVCPGGRDDIRPLLHDSRARPPLGQLIAAHWRRYAVGSRTCGRRRTLSSLARYAVRQGQRLWQARRRRRVSYRPPAVPDRGELRAAPVADDRAGARPSAFQPGGR
jgi:hypothetical protein